MKNLLWLALLLTPLAFGQPLNLQSLDRFTGRAKSNVNVSLDGSLLQLAAKFLSSDDPDQAKVQKVVNGLKGIYVRSFEFDKAGGYSRSDMEGIRGQLQGGQWSRILDVQSASEGEHSEIYLQMNKGVVSGLALLISEPKELTVVQIVGPIDLESLSQLGGKMGIPNIKLQGKSRKKD